MIKFVLSSVNDIFCRYHYVSTVSDLSSTMTPTLSDARNVADIDLAHRFLAFDLDVMLSTVVMSTGIR